MLGPETVTVIYDPTSGSGGPGTDTTSPQDSYKLLTDPAPTHEDVESIKVVFVGWSETEDSTIYTEGENKPSLTTVMTVEENQTYTVYAVYGYDANEDGIPDVEQKFVTLTYDANGGTGAPAAEKKLVTGIISERFDISSVEPSRQYYTFKGWAETADATEARYRYDTDGMDGDILLRSDQTLYAVWEENPTYTLRYNANGGKNAPDPQSQVSEEINGKVQSRIVITNAVPSRDGYVFRGWATSPRGSAAFLPGETVYISDGDVTLYAVWARSGGGGSGSDVKTGDESRTGAYIAAAVLSAVAIGGIAFALTKTGYSGRRSGKNNRS